MFNLIDDLDARGLLAECTDLPGLRDRLQRGPITAYCGFDPTADSLHVGSLKPLWVLRTMQQRGHRPVLLIGGATGFIGDPSGRSLDRNMLSVEELNANRAGLRRQMMELLPPGANGEEAIIVDNREWLSDMTAIDLLRDVGRYFRINEMLRKDSVRTRLESESGMSFTEFAYSLLQAKDFEYLRNHLDCELQLGGTDQWGNITAGLELMRRRGTGEGYGLVWPLLVKSDGGKFGKSAQGNIWLDAKRTSPFSFYQFWVNTADQDVEKLLLQFGDTEVTEVVELMTMHVRQPEARLAQLTLAEQVTRWVHGAATTRKVKHVSEELFGDPKALDSEALDWIAAEVPTTALTADESRNIDIVDAACRSGITASRGEAKRLIQNGGLYIDGQKAVLSDTLGAELARKGWMILRKGRRQIHLVRSC